MFLLSSAQPGTAQKRHLEPISPVRIELDLSPSLCRGNLSGQSTTSSSRVSTGGRTSCRPPLHGLPISATSHPGATRLGLRSVAPASASPSPPQMLTGAPPLLWRGQSICRDPALRPSLFFPDWCTFPCRLGKQVSNGGGRS